LKGRDIGRMTSDIYKVLLVLRNFAKGLFTLALLLIGHFWL
jgi:hypothetical protein